MPLRCIIVEDEPLAQERLAGFVRKLASLELVGTFDDALAALAFVKSRKVDLMFLDITLGGISGIELLEASRFPARVILTTAHQEFALKAFDLQVADYLLKPFTFQRFVQAVDHAAADNARGEPPASRPFIFVKTEQRLERLPLGQILYIEGMRDYRQIRTVSKRIMTLQTFTELEQAIPRGIVCRVHKSYMVAIDRIESIEKDRIKIADALIPISETYRDAFYALIDPRRGSRA
jgi:two-component system LytT family response regulator